MRTATEDLCACGQTVEAQHQRHLTAEEYAAIPEALRPIDGYATRMVRTCGDCAPPPFCEHPGANEPAPCPSCGAPPGELCAKADGSVRAHPHPSRALTPVIDTCRHAHRADCDPRDCRCTGDEPQPERPARPTGPQDAPPDLSGLGFPPEMLLGAAAWMAANHIDRALIRGQFRTGLTQDNRPAMLFDYADPGPDGRPVVDEHGHEEVQLRIVPLPQRP